MADPPAHAGGTDFNTAIGTFLQEPTIAAPLVSLFFRSGLELVSRILDNQSDAENIQ
jgi:hypothetical protein